jgi:hypothetical protein
VSNRIFYVIPDRAAQYRQYRYRKVYLKKKDKVPVEAQKKIEQVPVSESSFLRKEIRYRYGKVYLKEKIRYRYQKIYKYQYWRVHFQEKK